MNCERGSSIDRKGAALTGPPGFPNSTAPEPADLQEAGKVIDTLRETEEAPPSIVAHPAERNSAVRPSGWPRFSLLAILIAGINLIALIILMMGVLFVNQRSENLIAAHKQSLGVQGRMIADILAETAVTVSNDVPRLDRELAIPLLRRLIDPDQTLARLYNVEGRLIADSNLIKDVIVMRDLPPLGEESRMRNFFKSIYDWLTVFLTVSSYYPYAAVVEEDQIGQAIQSSLRGESIYVARRNEAGELIVSFTLPVQPLQQVLGVLLLEVSDIDKAIRAERENFLQVFAVAFIVSVISSFFLARTIAGPIRRLAAAADVVRLGKSGRTEIPDLTTRRDEIGHLSGSLRAMTSALYDRIDAIESFAADVAHEIKNPLTSLRSAAETFHLAKTDEMRAKLLKIINNDVGRIDRLISDISNASRLDAELARQEAKPVNMAALLETLVEVYNMTKKEGDPSVVLDLPTSSRGEFLIWGLEGSLGQVFRNLLDNAKSFSPRNSKIWIRARTMRRDRRRYVVVQVEDQGPGIPQANLTDIFERFYTERLDRADFGKHSGLGLSICQQIVEAHGGTIRAENRQHINDGGIKPNNVSGARFVVTLPVSQRD